MSDFESATSPPPHAVLDLPGRKVRNDFASAYRAGGVPRARGFTLLEIMVVVVLIGITVTLVALSFDRDVDRVAEREAERFAALLDLVRDESILSGQTLAIEVDEEGRTYRFLRAEESWVPVTGDSILRPRTLPEFLNVRLDLPERSSKDAEPRVVVRSLGDVAPFVLTIIGERSVYQVTIDSGQNLVINKRDHEAG